MKLKIVLYHNIVAPYRHALFESLNKVLNIEVWYSALLTRDRKWSPYIPNSYKYKILPHVIIYMLNKSLIFCPTLIKELEKARPDVIISVYPKSNILDIAQIMIWTKYKEVPLILWVGSFYVDKYRSEMPLFIDKIFQTIYEALIKKADGYMFYSNKSKEWAKKIGISGPFICGTQVLEKPPINPRIECNNKSDNINALYVGKLEKRKGFDLLINICEILPENIKRKFSLHIIGDGAQRYLINRLKRRGINVVSEDYVPREVLWYKYRNADVLIMPSRYDPWGFVANESMSMGTPVIASEQCGAEELVMQSGWICNAFNPESLYYCIIDAINNSRDPIRRMRAIIDESKYRPSKVANDVYNLINKINKNKHF